MKTLEQASTRELEIAQVKLAIVRTDEGIKRMETALASMREKQTARRCEIVRQETLARHPKRESSAITPTTRTDCNESAPASFAGAHGSGAVDPVNHPPHYTQHPSAVECIQATELMNFCLVNAVKYIWRADLKNDAIEDLEKARWYVIREIERRKRQNDKLTRDAGAKTL